MSSNRGSSERSRSQKYQNKTTFRNDLYVTSKMTKFLNTMDVNGVCQRCKDIIDWKIKYKKYKPLTKAKTCAICKLKTVKVAYHALCNPCVQASGKCAKCSKEKEIILQPPEEEEAKLQAKFDQALTFLPERQKRAFIRSGKSPKDYFNEEAEDDASENVDTKIAVDINVEHCNLETDGITNCAAVD